jgi:hypothetical protein
VEFGVVVGFEHGATMRRRGVITHFLLVDSLLSDAGRSGHGLIEDNVRVIDRGGRKDDF